MKIITATFISLIHVSLFAQQHLMKSNAPRYKIRLTTISENKLKGLLLKTTDSSLVIYPGKRKEWKKKIAYKPVEFTYSTIRSFELKKKNGSWKEMPIGAAIDTTILSNTNAEPRRLNFVVSPKQKKLDGAPFSFQLQAHLMRWFHRRELYVVIAQSSEDAVNKITAVLDKENAMIGNLWFDSHGHFPRRRSLFEIGDEEFNYLTVRDSVATVHLQRLAIYCDTNTKVGIGSCYGGATFILPAIETFPEQRMNGDSLMMGVSKLFSNATVYACESFVLTGPGIMNAGYALCGSPLRKKFKDPIYAPVWERLGEWNRYSGKTGRFESRVSVSLDPDGSIYVKPNNYLALTKNRKKQSKKLMSLKKGNYNMAVLYQQI